MAVALLPDLDASHVSDVQSALLSWYREVGRDLPWRSTHDPYAILVSEVMLQQTQVARVIPKWRAWLDRFPTLASLAGAPRADVIRAWSGMGYNRRALWLQDLARHVLNSPRGGLPDSYADLLNLPGIGPYTAAAVACFAFGEQVACVDTNIRRCLGRIFLGIPEVKVGTSQASAIAELAEAALPAGLASDWNQALMDLGATVCTAARPACLICPVSAACNAAEYMPDWTVERKRRLREARASYAIDRHQSDAHRALRGRVVEAVRGIPTGQCMEIADLTVHLPLGVTIAAVEAVAHELARDGLLCLEEVNGGGLRVRLPD